MIDTIKMLKVATEKDGLKNITICFHGGEPLMLSRKIIDWICYHARESIPKARIRFSLQTNAVLMDEEWAKLMNKHDIGVGVSIDGPREEHD